MNVPHAGTHVPWSIAPMLTADARAMPDTDWHVEKLYAFAADAGATLMCATHSRYVVDLNRDPSGAALYAGADNTEVCPLRTFADAPVYVPGAVLTTEDIGTRVAAYFLPYHAALAAEIARVRERHGYAVLLDGHSIRARGAALFRGAAARPQSRHRGRRERRVRRCRRAPRRCWQAPPASRTS